MDVHLDDHELVLRAGDPIATYEISSLSALVQFLRDRAGALLPKQCALVGAFSVALGVMETASSDPEVVGKWLDAHYLALPESACRVAFNDAWSDAMGRLRAIPSPPDKRAARTLVVDVLAANDQPES